MTKQELTEIAKQRIASLQDIAYNIRATISKRQAASSRLAELESIYEKIKQLDDPQPQPPQEPCKVCGKLGQQPNCYREIFSDLLVRDDCNSDPRAHMALRTNYCPNCGRKLTEEKA